MDSGANQTDIDKFLKLDVVSLESHQWLWLGYWLYSWAAMTIWLLHVQTHMHMCPSYAGKWELLWKIDALPLGLEWTCHTFVIHGDQLDYNGEKCTKELDIWCHDPVACVNELLANPMFHEHMKFGPEKHFMDDSEEDQIINEMWITQWWWNLQAT